MQRPFAGDGTVEALVLPFPNPPRDRLHRALCLLDAALAAQHVAVGEWQREVHALGSTMAGLQDRVAGFRAALDQAAARTAQTGTAMRRLPHA